MRSHGHVIARSKATKQWRECAVRDSARNSQRARPGPGRTHTAESSCGAGWETTIVTMRSCGYGSRPSRDDMRIVLDSIAKQCSGCVVDATSHSRDAFASEACIVRRPRRDEGAGKAGWPLHPGPSRRKNCASARTTGTGGDHTGPPCAMVYGLWRALPGEPCRLPPSPSRSL